MYKTGMLPESEDLKNWRGQNPEADLNTDTSQPTNYETTIAKFHGTPSRRFEEEICR